MTWAVEGKECNKHIDIIRVSPTPLYTRGLEQAAGRALPDCPDFLRLLKKYWPTGEMLYHNLQRTKEDLKKKNRSFSSRERYWRLCTIHASKEEE